MRPAIVERSSDGAECLETIELPLLRRVYAGRGVRSADALDYGLNRLPHFRDLRDIDRAVALLDDAIERAVPVLVVGDFDADGATSTALACEALVAFGAARVNYFIPHRAKHGYGLSPLAVEAIGAAPQGGGLILTVDNGIAAHAGVDSARAAGWQVVVSDHHLPGETLPTADAIVNPNQPGCVFSGKALAGVGVVFYLMAALRARRAGRAPGRDLPRMGDYLDLVALGTVADVVALDHVNRTLVSQGLRRIRAGRARAGIVALAEIAGRDIARLDTSDIGFALAPRLNAAGRLEDMGVGVECLRARTPDRARLLAEELSAINRRRRLVQQRMQEDAEQALARIVNDAPETLAITVYRGDWHEGVVGLIAAKLRERQHRPVVAFAPGEQGLLKGSARSIPGLHIRDVLAAVDASAPGLIVRFGGHAQAAGLSLPPEALPAFQTHFEHAVTQRMTPAMAAREFVTDGEVAEDELSLAVAEGLRTGGPWGPAFEPPLFHGLFEVAHQRIVGTGHLKLSVRPAGGQRLIEAMVFNCDQLLDKRQRHRLVYRLEVNTFRGDRRANLIVEYMRDETEEKMSD